MATGTAYKISEKFVKIQINECLISVSNWSGANAFLASNAECAQPGTVEYIKTLYEEQSNDETGKSFLDQLPERTWRWPLTKQRADVELLMLKNTRQTNTHAKVDKLDEIGRSMILEEGDVWPCNLNRDGIAILHGASLLKTNPSKFEPS